MSRNNSALLAALADAAFDGLDALACAVKLNADVVSRPQRVSKHSLARFLFDNGLYAVLQDHQNPAGTDSQKVAVSFFVAISSELSDIDVNHATFQAGLVALVADSAVPEFSQAMADGIRALGQNEVSLAVSLGWGGLRNETLAVYVRKIAGRD